MNNEPNINSSEQKQPISFGLRLKNAREALGLDRKDVAQQLRLNEKIIIMMEKDRYPADLPVTFIRGYLRSYGKFLDIPENEVKKAVEPIKPKATLPLIPAPINKSEPWTSDNYFMQFLTYAIFLTLIGLVVTWWYTHSTSNFNKTDVLTIPPAKPIQTMLTIVHPVQTTNMTPIPKESPILNQTQNITAPPKTPEPAAIQPAKKPKTAITEAESLELPLPIGASNDNPQNPPKKIESSVEQEDYGDD